MAQYEQSKETICVGDKVLYAEKAAVVVFVIEDGSYSLGFPAQHWSHLGCGIGLELDDGTLYHLPVTDEDLVLVSH